MNDGVPQPLPHTDRSTVAPREGHDLYVTIRPDSVLFHDDGSADAWIRAEAFVHAKDYR